MALIGFGLVIACQVPDLPCQLPYPMPTLGLLPWPSIVFMESSSEDTNQLDQRSNEKVSFTLEVDPEIAAVLEKLQAEYGAISKGRVVEMLLNDLIIGEDSEPGE